MQRDLNLLLVKPNELPKKITIKNTLKEKPQYHNDFIQKSIDELDRLKTNE